MDTLQSRLAGARKAAGLTQATAARRLLVTTTTVARWELRSGQYRPTLAHLEDLASLYGVTLGALLDNPPVLGRWARDHFQRSGSLGPPIGQSIQPLSIEDQVAEEFASLQSEQEP